MFENASLTRTFLKSKYKREMKSQCADFEHRQTFFNFSRARPLQLMAKASQLVHSVLAVTTVHCPMTTKAFLDKLERSALCFIAPKTVHPIWLHIHDDPEGSFMTPKAFL